MNDLDKELKEIKHQKYLISMQIRELKKQLVIKKQEEARLLEEKGKSRKRVK